MSVEVLLSRATDLVLATTNKVSFFLGLGFILITGMEATNLIITQNKSGTYYWKLYYNRRPRVIRSPEFSSLRSLLRSIRHWRVVMVEFADFTFQLNDADKIAKSLEKLGVRLLSFRNCFFDVPTIEETRRLLQIVTMNNKVCSKFVVESSDQRLLMRNEEDEARLMPQIRVVVFERPSESDEEEEKEKKESNASVSRKSNEDSEEEDLVRVESAENIIELHLQEEIEDKKEVDVEEDEQEKEKLKEEDAALNEWEVL